MKRLIVLLASGLLVAACNDQNAGQGGTGSDTGTSSGSDSGSGTSKYNRTDTNAATAVPQSDTQNRDLGTKGGNVGSGSDNSATPNSATR